MMGMCQMGDVSDGGYLLDDTPMGGSPRPMEPMGPHRPRALKYTPTGGSSRPGSLRPIGPGPSAMAHRPWPMEPMGPPWEISKKKNLHLEISNFPCKKYDPPPKFDHPMAPQEPSRKVYLPVFQPPGPCINHLCSKYRFL